MDKIVITIAIDIITNRIVGDTLVGELTVGTSVIGFVGKVFDHEDGVPQTLKIIVLVIRVTVDICWFTSNTIKLLKLPN